MLQGHNIFVATTPQPPVKVSLNLEIELYCTDFIELDHSLKTTSQGTAPLPTVTIKQGFTSTTSKSSLGIISNFLLTGLLSDNVDSSTRILPLYATPSPCNINTYQIKFYIFALQKRIFFLAVHDSGFTEVSQNSYRGMDVHIGTSEIK